MGAGDEKELKLVVFCKKARNQPCRVTERSIFETVGKAMAAGNQLVGEAKGKQKQMGGIAWEGCSNRYGGDSDDEVVILDDDVGCDGK